MSRPPRACACGRIVPHGQLCVCQIASKRARGRRYDAKRPTAAQRGYNQEWRKARIEFLRLFPCCAMCGAPATVVDHIKPHRGDERLFWDRSNWQALCEGCHNRHKQRQEAAP
ncbi:HNH endonuclease [Thioclava nitratireducens]|uniref:Putative HNH nuclease YajD n=1 Tax=Thioclava nitratireducens TaxID=1915078 RepID=A0ABM6IHB3_9RHOB|nr:HNH endonuclease [Thioclava nitratireducens]AQS48094.1 HNH endonuclease [Thioclava nitratireducens]